MEEQEIRQLVATGAPVPAKYANVLLDAIDALRKEVHTLRAQCDWERSAFQRARAARIAAEKKRDDAWFVLRRCRNLLDQFRGRLIEEDGAIRDTVTLADCVLPDPNRGPEGNA